MLRTTAMILIASALSIAACKEPGQLYEPCVEGDQDCAEGLICDLGPGLCTRYCNEDGDAVCVTEDFPKAECSGATCRIPCGPESECPPGYDCQCPGNIANCINMVAVPECVPD